MANRWVFRRPHDYRKKKQKVFQFGPSLSRSASSTLVLLQAAQCVKVPAKQVSSMLVLTQSLSNPLLSKLVLSQTVSLAGSTYNKSVTSSLALVQVLTRVLTRSASSTLVLDHAVGVVKVRAASSTLVLDHAVTGVGSRHAPSLLELVQDVSVIRVRREAFSTLVLASAASHHGTIFNRLVTTFWTSLTQKMNPGPRSDWFPQHSVVHKRVRLFSASSGMNLNHVVDISKIVRPSSSLVLVSSVAKSKVVQPNLVSSLALASVVSIDQTLNKLVVSQLGLSQVVVGTKVKRLVILQAPEDAIVLPRPLLGDKESSTNLVDVKRSISGVVRTYVRTSETKRLTYTFQMRTDKALELKAFIDKHPADLMRMENFKGEIWQVRLMNDPFELVYDRSWKPCKEAVVITLELEGTKLYG
jgi:hypothetical protein